MTVQEIEKLKKVDEIMFNLQNSTDPQKALLQAGEFLKGLNLIDDQTNIRVTAKLDSQFLVDDPAD